MTAPHPDGADQISGVAKSPLSASAAASGIAVLLLVGLLLRLTIAYVLLPGSGFESDLGTFTAWAFQLGQRGPSDFYATAGFADYPPGYLYVLWLIGGIGHMLAPLASGDAAAAIGALIKVPPIVTDIVVGFVLYRLVRSWRAPRLDAQRLGLFAAGLYVFNPVTWYDSAIWGQTDAIGALVLLLTVAALVRGNAEGATALAVVAALIKPQFGVVAIPVVGVVLLRRHLLRAGVMPQHEVLLPPALRGWFERERGIWRLLSSAVTGLALAMLLLLPFSLDIFGYVNQMIETAGGYPYLSVNAYNPWALVGAGGTEPLAFNGYLGWSPDTVPFLGPIPAVLVGGMLLALGFGLGALRLAWLDDRRSIVVVTIFFAFAFFMLPTRVHERYMFPIFGLLPLLAAVDRRWLVVGGVLSVAALINMHGVLTVPIYATPNLEDLLAGDVFREPLAIVTSIALHVGGFAFICWMLRPAAAHEPDPYVSDVDDGPTIADAGLTPARQTVDGATGGRWTRPLAGLVPALSTRRDRSALLVGEPGGRLDRRDLGLVALVFISALLLRTYRLEQPFSMHFDEVYHARTAVEFLQDWRYDMPHTIYEFTHPHLAKYGMALGIETLGNNRVVSTGDLGTPVRAAAIEERWSETTQPGAYLGDRLYVLSGSELRAYDMSAASRPLVYSSAGPFVGLAVDPATHTVFLAGADGTLARLPTDELDLVRRGASIAGLEPESFGSVAGLAGELSRLDVAGAQLIATSSGGTVVSIDPETGAETGRAELGTVGAITRVPTRSVVMVDPALVTDRAALAESLAGLLDLDAAAIDAAIAAADGPVPIAGYIAAVRDDVEAQIDEGALEGVSVIDGDGIAVATSTGIRFFDAVTLVELAELANQAPVTGLDVAEEGPDQPTLYAAAGDRMLMIRLASDQTITLGGTVPMPNSVRDVYWNPATTMLHVLGSTQDGTAPTVYVVEPRSNSVFADARLDFAPATVVMDSQPDRPAEDRADLLALAGDGRVATVDVGNNQFAYRFPGVLLGALMAALIYLLARFLFRRRSVAVIAALLVLADGMFFANARIAMNDAYVAFFIVAAFTVFVPLWLGRWRGGWATAGGLAAVGLLLGLALSSKWVGAYAIGAVGLLILLRSALGRLIALAAMIVMTGALGYLAITPSTTVETPQLNYVFVLMMIALTLLLAVAIAVRPVRLTRDELRLAIVAPVLGGALALAFGAYRLATGTTPTAGASTTPVLAIIAGSVLLVFGAGVFALTRILGARGRGPWAHPSEIDPDREPAAPPPARGWLRPGSGALGLPWLLALAAIVVLPLAVYLVSYVPWIDLGNRWDLPFFPVGEGGQAFLDLQKSMYDYHNNLRATHAASSPWWAWPLDLKPVWFEQNDYAGGTTSVIYDTGNLVIFWLAIPAVAWLCWQAWRRRSLPLTFIAIAIASMWLPWARIDRATFQYHIFTTLPFSFLALAYFLAELWHGPSPRTWALARVGAALAIVGAPLLWLLRKPLCAIANTEQVNSGTEVCAGLARDLVLTDFQLIGVALAVIGLVGAGILFYLTLRDSNEGIDPPPSRRLLFPITFAVAFLGVVLAVVGAALEGNPVFTMPVSAEEPALIALVLLAVPAYFVLRASDPRRFVMGTLAAAVAWFVAFYPNFASLPVPTPLSQIHLGLLPTWNWGFQFGVNLDEPNRNPIDVVAVSLLTLAVIGLCVSAVFVARNWYALRNERADVSPLPETS